MIALGARKGFNLTRRRPTTFPPPGYVFAISNGQYVLSNGQYVLVKV